MLPLRTPPSPRPQPLDEAVLLRAAQARHPSIDRWASAAGFNIGAEAMDAALVIAMSAARLEPYRMCRVLEEHFLMRPDYELVRMIGSMVEHHADVLRLVVREWVAATGHRFPGEKDNQIEYVVASGHRHMGYVRGIDRGLAVGYVTLNYDQDSTVHTVFAENVISNISQDRHDPETPVLGQRYDNAPALAAEFERNRALVRGKAPAAPASRVLGDDEEGPSAA